MKFLTTLLIIFSSTCFAQESSKKGTIKVVKKKENNNLTATKFTPQSKTSKDTISRAILGQTPTYPGGANALNEFLKAKLIYPTSAKEAGISGTSYVNFTVEKDGKITNINLLKGLAGCPQCDAEAIKAIKLMPPWNPLLSNGAAIAAQINLPIKFSLK